MTQKLHRLIDVFTKNGKQKQVLKQLLIHEHSQLPKGGNPNVHWLMKDTHNMVHPHSGILLSCKKE